MKIKEVSGYAGAIYFITIFLLGCASTKNMQLTTSNGNTIEFITEGNGNPTLIFETGMGPSIDTWDKILDSLSKHTKVYAYNRPGYGNSKSNNPPRSMEEVARQLHANLVAQDIAPPYVLIGHSLGGLYINMFARLYPVETAGAIFIDASHPEQFEYFKSDQQLLYNLLITSTKKGKRTYEYDIVTTTLHSFNNAPRFPEIPLSVLIAGKSSPLENKNLRIKWLEFQDDLANLSHSSKKLIVADSGHYIHRNAPEITITEILRILELSRVN